MLSDRPYMRHDEYVPQRTTKLTWLLCAIAAGFILQTAATVFHADAIPALLQLSAAGIERGFLWMLVTHPFLHTGILSLAVTGLGLWMLGPELITLMGEKRFFGLLTAATVLGGSCWLALHFNDGSGANLMGASAALAALVTCYVCVNPNRRITLLLFFVFPVTFPPIWTLALLGLGLELAGLVYWEILRNPYSPNIAFSAQLGGMIAGLLYHRFIHLREWQNPDGPSVLPAANWRRSKNLNNTPVAAPRLTPNLASRQNLKAELDRILDKINSDGIASLTADEKRLLDEAKDLLSRN